MDYEKKYRNALGWMRAVYPTLNGMAKEDAEHFFPELIESDDKRIWEAIVREFERASNSYLIETYDLSKDKFLAYLEKQKDAFENGRQLGIMQEQARQELGWPDEKQKEQKHPDGCFTCDEYKKGYEEGRRNGFTAGYNKAIKEVEQKEQKPAEWSEEDKCMYDSIMCEVVNEGMNLTPAQVNWIKLLPERFVLQPKQEWSEEDEKKLEDLTSLLAILEGCSTVNVGTAAKYSGWLKSFRSRPKSSDNWKPSEKQINALQDSIDLDKTVLRRGRLIGLLEDLKRLM